MVNKHNEKPRYNGDRKLMKNTQSAPAKKFVAPIVDYSDLNNLDNLKIHWKRRAKNMD